MGVTTFPFNCPITQISRQLKDDTSLYAKAQPYSLELLEKIHKPASSHQSPNLASANRQTLAQAGGAAKAVCVGPNPVPEALGCWGTC